MSKPTYTGEFRDANEYLRGMQLARIIGYYTDEFCDETAVPAVFVTRVDCAACANPERTTDCVDCEVCEGSGDIFTYRAAVRDPVNDGYGVVDFEESYTDASEAARAAHSLAERYAESEREYREVENARHEAQENIPEDIRHLRKVHTHMVTLDDASGARARREIREQVSKRVKRIRELRSQYANQWEAQS